MDAEVREKQDKGAGRHLRAANKFPAIVYGGKEAPLAIKLDHDKAMNMRAETEFYGEVLTIVVDGEEIKAKAQDAQRHPYRLKLQYIDFAHT